jgi:hypothetical protein
MAGTLVTDAPRSTSEPSPSSPRPRRRSTPWLKLGVVAVLFLGLLACVVGNAVQANHRYDTARRSVLAMQVRLRFVKADLADAVHELEAADGQVASATTALNQEVAELTAARTALSGAQSHVSSQSTTIGALNSCLGGVEQALNALSVNDQHHAITALQAVMTSCQTAAGSSG